MPEIDVSTKTIIAISNLKINLEKFFEYTPITPFKPIEKKRGRKKKIAVEQTVEIVPEGSVINVQKKNIFRGVLLKKKKNTNTYFLHSVTMVLSIEKNKFINIKVSANGKFQITGCKNDDQCIKTLKYIYKHIKISEVITGHKIVDYINEQNKMVVLTNTVMQNMDYNIGFNISRDKLNTFINSYTDFCSIYEGSISTGVNIKIPSSNPYDEYINKLTYSYDANTCEEKEQLEHVDYDQYKSLLEDKQKNKEHNKEKYHTFLVFASGSIIMSSRGPLMKMVFNNLINMLQEYKDHFEEKISH
jgi:TATA-box binding protein (TBP) (component of TFIID and TFIIIB)